MSGLTLKKWTILPTDPELELNSNKQDPEFSEVTFGKISTKVIEVDQKKVNKKCYGQLGLFLTLLAGIIIQLDTLCAKILIKSHFHPFTVTFIKFQGMTTIGPLYVLFVHFYQRKPIFSVLTPISNPTVRRLWIVLIFRSACGVGATATLYTSLKYLTIADAATIKFMNSIFTLFLARLLLKEPIGIIPIIMSIAAIFGVIIISRPPILTGQHEFDINLLIGIGFAILCMICLSLIFVAGRYMRKMNFGLLVTLYGYIGTTQLIILVFIFGVQDEVFYTLPPINMEFIHYIILLAVAILSLAGQACSTCAVKYENAGLVAVYRTCDIIFAFIIQFIFLSVVPDIFSFIGASLILVATITIGFRKYLLSLPKENSTRRQLGWITK